MSFRRILARTVAVLALGTALAAVTPAGAAESPPTVLACTHIGQAPNTVARFTLYDSTGLRGSCITFYGYGSCTPTTGDNEGRYNLGTFGWDNRASSVNTYNRCDVRLFDAVNCPADGARTPWIHRSLDLGNWSNRASCVEVS